MSQLTGTPRAREAGLLRPIDGVVHAVDRKLSGNVAVCGAGHVEIVLVDRFDPDAHDACPECVRLLLGPPTQRIGSSAVADTADV